MRAGVEKLRDCKANVQQLVENGRREIEQITYQRQNYATSLAVLEDSEEDDNDDDDDEQVEASWSSWSGVLSRIGRSQAAAG